MIFELIQKKIIEKNKNKTSSSLFRDVEKGLASLVVAGVLVVIIGGCTAIFNSFCSQSCSQRVHINTYLDNKVYDLFLYIFVQINWYNY